ncbi:unnamed protein product [Closterium sp. NIES-53]
MASSHSAASGAHWSHFDSALLTRLLCRNPLRDCRGSGGSGEEHFADYVTLASIPSNITNPIAPGGTDGGGERGAFSGSPTSKEEKAESYQWKKYGHKFLSSQNAKRFYYHCTERDTTGCPAKLIIDKVPKKKNGRRAELKDLVAREVPGSSARRPPVDGAVVAADRESGSPRPAVTDREEKGEEGDDSSFGWEENREILDALPVLERRVDRTLTPRRFWCRNRHNHLPPPQQPLHMVVSAAAVAQPRMYVTAAGAGAVIASAAASVLPPPPAGIMTVPPAASLIPTIARMASSTSDAVNAGGGGGSGSGVGTPRGPLTPNLADWPFPPKSRSPPVGPRSPEPATAGLERGSPLCGFPPSGSPPCAHAGRKRPRSPARASVGDHHATRTTTKDFAACGAGAGEDPWYQGSAMMARRQRSGSDCDVLAVKRGDPSLHPHPVPPAAPGPSIFQYLFPHVGALSARSTLEAPLLSSVLESLRPTATGTAAAKASTGAAAAAAGATAAAGARQSASGYHGGQLGGLAGAQSPAAVEVGLTARLVFPRGVRVSSAHGDTADAGAISTDAWEASADANAVTEAEGASDVAPGKAEEGFDTLWSYVEANLRQRVASQAAAAAAAVAAATAAAAPVGVASQAAGTAGPNGWVMNESNMVPHRLAASLPRGLLGLAEAQRAEAPQQAEEGATRESFLLHAGSSCPVLPPLLSSIPAASASAAAAAAAADGGMAGRRVEEIRALYVQGLLGGRGLVGSGGEGLVGMDIHLSKKKMSALTGGGVDEIEGRRVCVDKGRVMLREAGGEGGGVVARVAVEMDLIGQLGDGTPVGRQAAGSGAPQVLSTDLCL